MAKIHDQQTSFAPPGDNKDQNTPASVQPITGGEALWEDNLGRPGENLRQRTEVLRREVDNLKYYSDYDRSLVVIANTAFTCTESDPGAFVLAMVESLGFLLITPALAPGEHSGGRYGGARMFVQHGAAWLPYAGELGTNDLAFTTTAGMRGYADADNFATDTNGVSLGANRLTITLVADPARTGGRATITATVMGTPATRITITYGTLTTQTSIADIIEFVATDASSMVSYGLQDLIEASSSLAAGSGGPRTTTAPPGGILNAVFQGGYDAEAHVVTKTDLTSFFGDVAPSGALANRLHLGEGLALSFESGPVQRRATGVSRGGRRQSIFDLPVDRGLSPPEDNTRRGAVRGTLFNTGREPEKIPGSIPIGRLLGGSFIFVDGTLVGSTPISLGESGMSLARLSSTSTPSGATLVGYGGSPNALFPAGTLENALDQGDTNLWSEAVDASGASRIRYDGSPNGWIPAGKLDLALDKIDTNLARTTATTGASRVGVASTTYALVGAGTVQGAFQDVETNLARQVEDVGGRTGASRVGVRATVAGLALIGNVQDALQAIETALARQADAGLLGPVGAGRVGYGGAGWHGDATAPAVIPAGTVANTLNHIAGDLAQDAAAGVPTTSGVYRIGSSARLGTPSDGNTGQSLLQTSLGAQLALLQNGAAGLNARVMESGHRLTTAAPLRKEFGHPEMPSAGAVMLQAELHAPANMNNTLGVREYASLNFQPIVYAKDATHALGVEEATVDTPKKLTFGTTAMTLARFANSVAVLPLVKVGGVVIPTLFVKLSAPPGDDAGIYYVTAFTPATNTITLKRLDGSDPSFDELSPSVVEVTFLSTVAVGSDHRFTRLHASIHNDQAEDGGGSPWALLAAKNANSKILEVYRTAASDGVLTAQLFPDKAVFHGAQRAGGVGLGESLGAGNLLLRDTTNLLAFGDKTRLDGVETGTPVDASLSHHHGLQYSQYVSRVEPAVFVTLGALPVGHYPYALALIVPNFRTTAVFLSFYVRIVSSAPAGPNAITVSYVIYVTDDAGEVLHNISGNTTVAPGAEHQSPRTLITVPAYATTSDRVYLRDGSYSATGVVAAADFVVTTLHMQMTAVLRSPV